MNAEQLKKIKPGGILINTSRGEVIDEDALYELLKEKNSNPSTNGSKFL